MQPIEEVLEKLAGQGYKIYWVSVDEGFVASPKGDRYTISLTGETYPRGCSCPARGPCKHLRAFLALIQCTDDQCAGLMLRGQMKGFSRLGTTATDVYVCEVCQKMERTENVRPLQYKWEKTDAT